MFKGLFRIIISYTLILFSLILGISLFSFSPSDLWFYTTETSYSYHNFLGSMGTFLAFPFVFFYGYASMIWAIFSLVVGIRLLMGIAPRVLTIQFFIVHYLSLIGSILSALIFGMKTFIHGGVIGSLLVTLMTRIIPEFVWLPIMFFAFIMGFLFLWNIPFTSLFSFWKQSKPVYNTEFTSIEEQKKIISSTPIEDNMVVETYQEQEKITDQNYIDEFYNDIKDPLKFSDQLPEFLQVLDDKPSSEMDIYLSKKPPFEDKVKDVLRDVDVDLLSPYMQHINPFYEKLEEIQNDDSSPIIDVQQSRMDEWKEISEDLEELDQSSKIMLPNSKWVEESVTSMADFVRKPTDVKRLLFDKGFVDNSIKNQSITQTAIPTENQIIDDPQQDVLDSLITTDSTSSVEELENTVPSVSQHISNFPPISNVTYDGSLLLSDIENPSLSSLNLEDVKNQTINQGSNNFVSLSDSEKILIEGLDRTIQRQQESTQKFIEKIHQKHKELAKKYSHQFDNIDSLDSPYVEEITQNMAIPSVLTTSFALQDFEKEILELKSNTKSLDPASQVLGDDQFMSNFQTSYVTLDTIIEMNKSEDDTHNENPTDTNTLLSELMFPSFDEYSESESKLENQSELIPNEPVLNQEKDTQEEELIFSQVTDDITSPQFTSLLRSDVDDLELSDISNLTESSSQDSQDKMHEHQEFLPKDNGIIQEEIQNILPNLSNLEDPEESLFRSDETDDLLEVQHQKELTISPDEKEPESIQINTEFETQESPLENLLVEDSIYNDEEQTNIDSNVLSSIFPDDLLSKTASLGIANTLKELPIMSHSPSKLGLQANSNVSNSIDTSKQEMPIKENTIQSESSKTDQEVFENFDWLSEDHDLQKDVIVPDNIENLNSPEEIVSMQDIPKTNLNDLNIDDLDKPESSLMPSVATEGKEVQAIAYPISEKKNFIFPKVEDLTPNTDQISKEDEAQEIETTMKMIEDTYESFNINMQVVDYNRGPTITRFELEPPSGLKLKSILNLQEDLALQAGTSNLRIISPVEGRSLIGIEVPNKVRRNFLLKEQVQSKSFKYSESALPLILGVDVGGKEIVGDLATTPHLLIAGTTGSGKSVYVNALIMGLLFKCSPKDLRFIMIDPKMVELELYNGIPHLLAPIITKPEEAMVALEWAVQEMDRRYKILSELSVRNIKEYQNLAQQSTIEGYENLPYIVIIVDEFANLMLRAPKDTERHISRLASMSRAVGIHLVLATQRPSVDVVTGVIKANFPSRIALRVSSKIDSRTIIDRNGAETLLGKGDMLYMSPENMEPMRIQSPYASNEDIAHAVQTIKRNGAPEYAINFSELLSRQEEVSTDGSRTDAASDPLFEEVLRFAVDNGEISASGIQRRFRVGYNRASRLIESMKDLKIITPPASAGKGWMVNITRDEVDKYL